MKLDAKQREAIRLLLRLRDAERDEGGKGYLEGLAERIRRGEDVSAAYLAQLREATSSR